MHHSRRPAIARTVILYDAECGFCVWAVSVFLRLDRHRALATRPIQDCLDSLLQDLPREEALASFHTWVPGGRRSSAGAALRTVLLSLPGLGLVGQMLGRSPRLAEAAYAAVALRRGLLARFVPERGKIAGRRLVEERRICSGSGAGARHDPSDHVASRDATSASSTTVPDAPRAPAAASQPSTVGPR